MALKIVVSSDLEALPSSRGDLWSSSGDDPFFDLRFGSFREPILVAFLKAADGETIEPKVYVNRGSGYREKDAITHERGLGFILVADVGRSGLIRSLRVDPASRPGEFTFSVHAFADMESAQEAIRSRRESDMADAALWDIGRLPRFRVGLPPLRLRSKKFELTKFVRMQRALASQLPTTRPSPENTCWLSIVVPVYNAPKHYLDDLVKSFEAQGIDGAELILSDDASTSAETLRWYKSFSGRSHVKVVRNAVNGGIAEATNAGLAEASGIWITLLDHDDVIAPHALKVIAKAIIDHPDVTFLYTDELVVD